MSAVTLTCDPLHSDQPPAGSVEVPVFHWLEVRAWLQPDGARFVQLVDESQETWASYCRMIVARSRAEILRAASLSGPPERSQTSTATGQPQNKSMK